MVRYPVAIEIGDEKHAYGVVIPDLPGVFSAGDTLDEALENAKEAILLAIEDYVERGEDLPAPTELEWLMVGKNGKGGSRNFPPEKWGWWVLDVDTGKLVSKAVRVNITLPEPLLALIDKYATAHGETRSGFIAHAAQKRLNAA